MGTIIISAVVIAVLALAVIYLVRQKKSGKPMCGGQCSNCPSGALCAASRKKDDEEKNREIKVLKATSDAKSKVAFVIRNDLKR